MQNGVSTLRVFSNIEEIPKEALQLFDAAGSFYPEFSAGWFTNLQQTVFPCDPGVQYHVAFRAGQPQVILPVRVLRRKLVSRVEALGNYYTSLYSPVVGSESVVEDISNLLLSISGKNSRVDEMSFAPMDPESSVYEKLLQGVRQIGWVPFDYFCFRNWHLKVPGEFGEYLNSRSGLLRNTIKRKSKKFAASGGTFEIITGLDRVSEGIADYSHVYARSWKQPEPYPEFIPGLIRMLAVNGNLRLGIARIGDRPVAAQIWITYHNKSSIYKLAYDEDFSDYSPGTLLTSYLMKYVIDCDRVREVDFLTGADPYKKDWMSHSRERRGIVAYNPKSIIGLSLIAKQMIGGWLKKAKELNQ